MWILLIIIASVCYAGEFSFVKIYQNNTRQKAVTMLFMMFVRFFVGAIFILCLSGFKLDFSNFSIWLTLIMAVILILYNVLGILILSMGTVAIYSMFMMLGGMLLPSLYGVLFLRETLSVWQIIAYCLLLFFTILPTLQFKKGDSEGDNKKGKILAIYSLLCAVAFLDNGSLGIVRTIAIDEMKVAEYSFAFSYFMLTALVGGVGTLVFAKKDKENVILLKACVKPKAIFSLLGLGVIANLGDILLLFVTGKAPASAIYPMVSGFTIACSAIASIFIFKEKLSKKELISVIGSFLATFLLIL